MQAIFAVRTTDGAGSPARAGSAIATSHDHAALSELVIIAPHIRPNALDAGWKAGGAVHPC